MRKLSLMLFTVLILASCSSQQANSVITGGAVETFLAKSKKPAVIKFYATWCGSCKQYAPIFEKVKLSQANSVDFYEVDVDAAATKDLVRELKISRIPETVFISTDRASIARKLGAISAQDLTKSIEELKAK